MLPCPTGDGGRPNPRCDTEHGKIYRTKTDIARPAVPLRRPGGKGQFKQQ